MALAEINYFKSIQFILRDGLILLDPTYPCTPPHLVLLADTNLTATKEYVSIAR